MVQSMFDSFLNTEFVRPFQSTSGTLKTSLLLKMAENVYKVVPVFFHEKYCILRPVFFLETGQVQLALLNSRSRVLLILRENYYRVRADADFAGAGQSIGSFLMSFDVRGGMISKIWAIVVGVTVKARFPQSGSWKTDDITIAILIRHIDHHNDAIMRS